MINISAEDSSYYYKRVVSLLADSYYPNVHNYIKQCVSSDNKNELEYFVSSLTSMIENIKKSTDSFYSKFKVGFDNPLVIDKCVSNIDFLHRKIFSKSYENLSFQSVSQEELFLSIMIHTSRELYRNRYLFDISNKSSMDKIIQVEKSINLIKKSIKKAINNTFMEVLITNMSRERMSDIRQITMSDGTSISVSDTKLMKLLEESSTDASIVNEEDEYVLSGKKEKEKTTSNNPFIRRGLIK
jgi:hypothetical protein